MGPTAPDFLELEAPNFWTPSTTSSRTRPENYESWFKDFDSLCVALGTKMVSFVMSHETFTMLNVKERNRMAKDTTEAAEELLKVIVLQKRTDLKECLIGFMQKQNLGHFLREPTLNSGPPTPSATALLPPNDRCYGRTDERQILLTTVLSPSLSSAIVYGMGGCGKTTLALDVLLCPRSEAKFSERRYFIRCAGLGTPMALVEAIMRSLGVNEVRPRDPMSAIVRHLKSRPAFVLIDNVESIWDTRFKTEVETILQHLCQSCYLVVTVRGTVVPRLVGKVYRVEVGRFNLVTAREVFVHHAPGSRNDPDLDALLNKLDLYPLAIVLISCQLVPGSQLRELLSDYERLRYLDGPGENKDTNFTISVKISLNAQAMLRCPSASQLLSLVSSVPDGLSPATVSHVFGSEARAATDALVQVGLAFRSIGHRVRILQPVKEILHSGTALIESKPEYLDRLRTYFMGIATKGRVIGGPNGGKVVEEMRKEFVNMESVLLRSVETGILDSTVLESARGLANFQRCAGVGGTQLLELVESTLLQRGRPNHAARIRAEQAVLLTSRSEQSKAEKLALSALHDFRQSHTLEGKRIV